MSKEQIEEMASDLENHTCMSQFQAEIASKMLYALGYRKQSEGEWKFIEVEAWRGAIYECTNCKARYNDKYNFESLGFAYCPNCGAKMKGGAE